MYVIVHQKYVIFYQKYVIFHQKYVIAYQTYVIFYRKYDFFINKIRSKNDILPKSRKKSACGSALWPRSSKVVKTCIFLTCFWTFKRS